MKPNEILHVELNDRYEIEQRKTIIESASPASVLFSVSLLYETNEADKVPVWFHVCTPDTGLARDFKFDIAAYSLETGQHYCQEQTSRGSRASRKIVVCVNPKETLMIRVTKPKTGVFAQWLLGKPKLWFNVAAHRNARQYDAMYGA